MGKLKWFLGIIGIILVIGILGGLLGDKNTEEPPIDDTTPPTDNGDDLDITSRQFEMGFFPIPVQPINADNWEITFNTLKENGEFVLLHGGMNEQEWTSFLESEDAEFEAGAKFVYAMAGNKNLKVLKTI